MSRIRTLNPRLEPVQPTSGLWEPRWNGEDTISNEWREPTSSWSVQESPRTLQCSERWPSVEYGGSLSLSSPFGSSRVH